MFTCKICKEDFKWGWEHVLVPKRKYENGSFFGFKDEAHEKAADKAGENNYQEPCPFCGSDIRFNGIEDAYEVVCSGCDYMFEED